MPKDEFGKEFTELVPDQETLPPGRFIGWLWDNVRDFFAAGFESIWGAFKELFPSLLHMFTNHVKDTLADVEDERWNNLVMFAIESGVLSKEHAERIKKYKDLGHPYDLIMYISFLLHFVFSALDIPADANSNFLRRSINKDIRPNLPDYRDVIPAAFVAPEKTGEVREILKQLGLSDEHIDLLFLSMYRLYPVETIRDAYLRGVLSEEEMFMRMRELGFTDTRIKEIVQTWELIPPVTDILTMVAHEAFEPDSIAKMGLDEEFPTEQVEWLKKQGLSEYWAMKYWISHWNQPSLGQGFEMLHRGVIDRETLEFLFRTVEIPRFWRDKLLAIAYMPYTRVDVRRMHAMGVLSDEELIKAYKDLGYDEEHALRMAEFTVRYNQQSNRDLTKAQIVTAYIEGLINRDDAKSLLKHIRYPDAESEYILTLAEFQRNKEYQDQIVKNVGERFKNNLIDEFEARNRLNQLNLPAEQIEILIDRWKIDKYEAVKVPSKTDLEKMLRNNIITQDQYRQEMYRLGYDWRYIDWYEQLARKKRQK
jgi:hypothetical protein